MRAQQRSDGGKKGQNKTNETKTLFKVACTAACVPSVSVTKTRIVCSLEARMSGKKRTNNNISDRAKEAEHFVRAIANKSHTIFVFLFSSMCARLISIPCESEANAKKASASRIATDREKKVAKIFCLGPFSRREYREF